MRKANKRPSDWLRLLCKDWAVENMDLVEGTDAKMLEYKPYLKGYLSSQLLCRLSIPPTKEVDTPVVDFWSILNIQDEFDKAYIVAQVERFCALYNIRGTTPFENDSPPVAHPQQQHQHASTTACVETAALYSDMSNPEHAATVAAAAAAANGNILPAYMTDAAAAAVAASAASDVSKLTKKQASEVSKAHRMAKDAEKALEQERRQNMKREQRRLSMERKEQKSREREALAVRKSSERIARESSREDRRHKKLELRLQREKFAHEQKEAALKRAAELVSSNRVPIEITRGAAAAKAAANAALQQTVVVTVTPAVVPMSLEDNLNNNSKKSRSAIVVSTASDLHQIVTHSKNLWAKYNAIAKEHNQKVNWITVAKELGIHVKVREKYARMHSRAEQRGFDWDKSGHWKIKDHPDIFLEPTQAEQKAKMPPPPPDSSTTVLISDDNKEVQVSADEAAVAAAAAVVDAAGVSGAQVVQTSHEEQSTAAAVAASLVADPTGGLLKAETTTIV
jgi:hypothetical protein